MEGKPYKLIEAVAETIATRILESYQESGIRCKSGSNKTRPAYSWSL